MRFLADVEKTLPTPGTDNIVEVYMYIGPDLYALYVFRVI